MILYCQRFWKARNFIAAFSILLFVFTTCPVIPDAAAAAQEVHYISSQEDLQEAATKETYLDGGTTGTVNWSISGNVLVISGKGKMPDYASGKAPWYSRRTVIKAVIIQKGITYIGSYAFKHIPMYAVSIPSSLQKLGFKSFAYTDRLRSVYYGGGRNSWSKLHIGFGNSALKTANVYYTGNSATAAAMARNKGLTSTTAKRSLRWTISGTTLTISGNGSMQNYNADYLFAAPWHSKRGQITKVVIENGVKSIGNYAFYDFMHLKVIQMARSVKRIGARAFYQCNGLNAVVIPDNVSLICRSAFQKCSSLSAVVLPRSINTVNSYCFSQCGRLRVVVIPAGVKKIEENAFWSCASLSKVNFRGTSSLWKTMSIESGNRQVKRAEKAYNFNL